MFHFQLVALSGAKFDDDVYEVILPTLDGEIGVLHSSQLSIKTSDGSKGRMPCQERAGRST